MRHRKTIKFLRKHIPDGSRIIDLGDRSVLSDKMNYYYSIIRFNHDLDYHYAEIIPKSNSIFTSFQVFEHLFAPFNFLNAESGKLVCSVPLKVWFSNAYWNESDKRDCHYHEFEIKQFNALLERTGWQIQDYEIWRTPDKLRFGIRPLLRFIFPSYYIVYATKK